MANRQKICIAVLIVFAALNSFKWAAFFVSRPYHPIDFRTYYLSSKAFFKNMNPYADSSQSALWTEEQKNEPVVWRKKTGFPHSVAVYAPQFVWYFSVYDVFSFTDSKWIQFALNIFAIGLIICCLKKLKPDLPYYLIILAIMAFRGTWYALEAGQPMLQVLAIMLLSLFLIEKRGLQGLPAVLLALVSFKFTLMIPVGIYLLCTRRFTILSIYAFLAMILNTIALLYTPMPVDMLAAWRSNIAGLWTYTHSYDTINGLNLISTSISVFIKYLVDIPVSYLKLFNLLFLLLGYGLSFYTGIKGSARAAMLIACLTGFCFGHHLVYDVLVLICFILLLKEEKLVHNVFFYLLAFVMMAPIGSMAIWLHAPWLDFVSPVCLLGYWACVMWWYLPIRGGKESS